MLTEKGSSEGLPTYTDAVRPWIHRRRKRRTIRFLAGAALIYFAIYIYRIAYNTTKPKTLLSVQRLHEDYATCAALQTTPVDPRGARDYNKRWVKGTKPTLIQNATIWTGEPEAGTSEEDARQGKGYMWITSDVFVDRGLIQRIAYNISIESLPEGSEVFNAHGRQLTAGIVDMHSHAGLSSVGNLQDDVNELSNDITPYVRSLDGFDPLQPEIQFIKSGGVTTSLLLPGSGNNMGGEAYVIKFAVGKGNGRTEISQHDLLADPEKHWRYMKMACGENAKRVYGKAGEHGPYSRLGEAWQFRHALEQAREYVRSQDDWCAAAAINGVEKMPTYLPQKLEWESLGAVLRGQVRVNTHCYTIPDLEAFVGYTNEFKFRLYAFHHAHQTYLIPEVLKRTWGGTPAAALFADNMYYKVEAYTASEKAGSILYAHNITPTYVSDNPVLNSQHVVVEAAKAYRNGLPYHAAFAGVTSASAELLGLGSRIGKIKEGFDADIVVWDSDPLAVGATPVQVWIDGAKQFEDPVVLKKPLTPPIKPNKDLNEEEKMRGLKGDAIFTGISYNYLAKNTESYNHSDQGIVIIRNGKVSCIGACEAELATADMVNTPIYKLKNGYITPPFTAFGTSLGLVEIDAERDTHDGELPSDGITRAVDGLALGGKHLAQALAHGVTKAISAPSTGTIDAKGVSVAFKTGAKNALQKGAIRQEEVALHYILTLGAKGDSTPSISSAIGLLRTKLLDAVSDVANNASLAAKEKYTEKSYLRKVVSGALPLVLSAHSADTIASIIRLKGEIEDAIATSASAMASPKAPAKLRTIVIGAAESQLVASELAAANVSVVLAPLLPHAQSWDQRRGLTGAPLTNGTTIDHLLDAGVLVGISVEELWETRDLGLLAGIAFANAEGRVGFKEALDLVGGNFARMLGAEVEEEDGWVVWEGSPLGIEGRVKAVGGVTEEMFLWE